MEWREQYHLPYNTKAVEKKIKWGRGRKFWERKSRFNKIGVGKNIK